MKVLTDGRNHGAGIDSTSTCSTVDVIVCQKILSIWTHNTQLRLSGGDFYYGIEEIKNKYK